MCQNRHKPGHPHKANTKVLSQPRQRCRLGAPTCTRALLCPGDPKEPALSSVLPYEPQALGSPPGSRAHALPERYTVQWPQDQQSLRCGPELASTLRLCQEPSGHRESRQIKQEPSRG